MIGFTIEIIPYNKPVNHCKIKYLHRFSGTTRYVLSGGSQRQEIVRHLNGAFVNGATEVRDLIAVSFVENIDSEEELELALQDVTAEALRAEWHVQHG